MQKSITEEEIKEISRQNGNKMVDFFMILLKIDKRTNPHLYNQK